MADSDEQVFMMANDPDIDDLLETPAFRSGVYGLWLHVFLISVLELKHGGYDTPAQAFLFDPENEFFNYVSECLGYEPDAMRKLVKKAADRKRGNHTPPERRGDCHYVMTNMPEQGCIKRRRMYWELTNLN